MSGASGSYLKNPSPAQHLPVCLKSLELTNILCVRERGSDRQPRATGELGLPAGNRDQSSRNITAIDLQPAKKYFNFLHLSPPVQSSCSLELHLKQGWCWQPPGNCLFHGNCLLTLRNHNLSCSCQGTKTPWVAPSGPQCVGHQGCPTGDTPRALGGWPQLLVTGTSLWIIPAFPGAFGFPSLPKAQAQVEPQTPAVL